MIVVAVPVHNEAGHIAGLLEALATQQGNHCFSVLLLLNNCSDGTAGIVASLIPALPMRVEMRSCTLLPPHAHAGMARRLAMDEAAEMAGPDGILMTTDADGMPGLEWISCNLAALEMGVEAVAGFAIIDPVDEAKLPPRLVVQEERVQLLTTLLDRIDSLLDPDPCDPWPRHTQHSGASIAVTVRAYRRAGGMPVVPVGEDRAFFDSLRRHDTSIRHESGAVVVVSGRLLGRADGGMADTMRRRIMTPDLWLDDPIETVENCIRRAKARLLARSSWQANGHGPDIMSLADLVAVSPGSVVEALKSTTFGACWQMLESGSLLLHRLRVPVCDCETEITAAQMVVERLERSAFETELMFEV